MTDFRIDIACSLFLVILGLILILRKDWVAFFLTYGRPETLPKKVADAFVLYGFFFVIAGVVYFLNLRVPVSH